MLKKTLAVIVVQICFLTISGQNKFNTHLLREMHKGRDTVVTCLVKGNTDQLRRNIGSYAGRVNYSASNISSVTLPLSHIKALAEQPYIQRMEMIRQKLRVLDDSALRKNKILSIHAGASPLTQAYTGEGVLLGVIDTGTDIHHPDFKDSSGKTRIAFLWDQRFAQAANTPQPYNYGQEWSATQIDSGHCTHDDYVEMSHGTKVAGVAASNGASNPAYRGIAPKAGIITVAIDFNNPGPTVTDALNYMISKATLLGKPLVVNISLGDYFGSHDGKDLQAQMIDNMINNLPGRALVAAAGNAGQIPFHLGYTVNPTDTNFTWVTNASSSIGFQVFADSLDFKNIRFRTGVYRNGSFSYLGNTGFRTIDTTLGLIRTDTLRFNGNRLGIISTTSDYSDNVYTLDVSIAADSLNYLWAFETNGTGKLDSWCFDYVHDSLPSASQLPRIVFYKKPDTLQTICTSFQCGKNAISVGNYTDRVLFTDVNGSPSPFDGTDNDLYVTSSIGPTRDGRIKPEIAASGENIATTGALPILSWLIQHFPFAVTQDSLHMTFGGTSAASPVVAGFAALYFQKYPTATLQQLRQDITHCSYQDLFTQATPNNRWGYGKLDGFGALTCRPDIFAGIHSHSQDQPGFNIYPNPAREWIYTDGAASSAVRINDVLGKEVYSNRINATKEGLPVSSLAPGLYFITLTGAGGFSSTQRFIKAD